MPLSLAVFKLAYAVADFLRRSFWAGLCWRTVRLRSWRLPWFVGWKILAAKSFTRQVILLS